MMDEINKDLIFFTTNSEFYSDSFKNFLNFGNLIFRSDFYEFSEKRLNTIPKMFKDFREVCDRVTGK